MAAIEMETDQTRQFLSLLTQYNLEIADYALAVMPSSAPVDTFVGGHWLLQVRGGADSNQPRVFGVLDLPR